MVAPDDASDIHSSVRFHGESDRLSEGDFDEDYSFIEPCCVCDRAYLSDMIYCTMCLKHVCCNCCGPHMEEVCSVCQAELF